VEIEEFPQAKEDMDVIYCIILQIMLINIKVLHKTKETSIKHEVLSVPVKMDISNSTLPSYPAEGLSSL
jgi:hypothetical protein